MKISPAAHVQKRVGTPLDLAFIHAATRPDGSFQVLGTSGMTLSESQLRHLKACGFNYVMIAYVTTKAPTADAQFLRFTIEELLTPI